MVGCLRVGDIVFPQKCSYYFEIYCLGSNCDVFMMIKYLSVHYYINVDKLLRYFEKKINQ